MSSFGLKHNNTVNTSDLEAVEFFLDFLGGSFF